jgi:hypothetical protein
MMRTVRLDTRRVCIAAARLSGAVSGWSRHPLYVWESMDITARDGYQRVTAAS